MEPAQNRMMVLVQGIERYQKRMYPCGRQQGYIEGKGYCWKWDCLIPDYIFIMAADRVVLKKIFPVKKKSRFIEGVVW